MESVNKTLANIWSFINFLLNDKKNTKKGSGLRKNILRTSHTQLYILSRISKDKNQVYQQTFLFFFVSSTIKHFKMHFLEAAKQK